MALNEDDRIVTVADLQVFRPHAWGPCRYCGREYEGAGQPTGDGPVGMRRMACGCGRTHCPFCGCRAAEPGKDDL